MDVTTESQEDVPTVAEMVGFLVETSRVLVACGCSSNRVEHLTVRIGQSWGFHVETLAIPTGVWIKVRYGAESQVDLARIPNWSIDLDKLARISDLVDSFELHQISLAEAKERMREALGAKAPYGFWLTALAGGLAASSLVFLYHGSHLEVLLAFLPGALVQMLQKYLIIGENRRHLADFISAAVVAFYAFACQNYIADVDGARIIVGGIITLLPGLTSVNAFHEIAQKNLVSGVAKLFEALVISVSLAFGVIVAYAILVYLGVSF